MVGSFDRFKRWRSKQWLDFVRSLPCGCGDPRCPNCTRGAGTPTRVVAAHLRSHSGMGAKPDDFMTYPLSDAIHRVFHNSGHPSVEWQLDRVVEVYRAAFRWGVLSVHDAEGIVPC